MNDCLVKRLKGVVDNDSLLKLGEMVIKCSTTACGGTTTEGMRTIMFSVSGTITAEGRTFKVKPSGSSSYSEVTEFTADATTECSYIFPDGEYKVHITGKYSITGFGTSNTITPSPFFSFNIEDLAYSADLYYLWGTNNYGITGELKYVADTVTAVKLNDYNSPQTNKAYININILENATALLHLDVYGRWNSEDEKSYGSINNLKSPVLIELLCNNSKITGDVNTMIQNMVTAGRTSGSIYIQGNGLLTVNGTPWAEFRNSLPGAGIGIRFTVDTSVPNNWTAARE